jgi:hypothetical protein
MLNISMMVNLDLDVALYVTNKNSFVCLYVHLLDGRILYTVPILIIPVPPYPIRAHSVVRNKIQQIFTFKATYIFMSYCLLKQAAYC